jgi:hypothetical protein
MKSVIVMGKGELAIRISNWFMHSPDWNLMQIVPVIPEPAWTDSFADWGGDNLIPVIESGDYLDVDMDAIDLVISVYYDRIIRRSFINRCVKILNLHNAPLPKYRGVRPINWALKMGEKSHGVTIHEIIPKIDAGAIYGQTEFGIDPKIDEVEDVYARCLYHGWELFLDVISRLDEIVPIPQDESKSTYYSADMNEMLWERVGWTRAESMPEWFRDQQRIESDFADRLVNGG